VDRGLGVVEIGLKYRTVIVNVLLTTTVCPSCPTIFFASSVVTLTRHYGTRTVRPVSGCGPRLSRLGRLKPLHLAFIALQS